MSEPGSRPITIPDNVSFLDLRMRRVPDGTVAFEWEPIEQICGASDIDVDELRTAHEEVVGSLILEWYLYHLRQGGSVDIVMEDLIAQVDTENERGLGFTHRPGRA